MKTKPEWLIRIEKEKMEKTGTLDLSKLQLDAIPIELRKMPWLTRLDLAHNNITEIKNLENLLSLKSLYFENNRIKEIENLQNLNKLDELFLSDNRISKIENLEKLQKLTILYLRNNNITKIENLKGLRNLRQLSLSENKIQKLENIENLTELFWLGIANNQIMRVENLSENKKLTSIDFSGNMIYNIEEIRYSYQLVEIDLSKNHISDVSILSILSELEKIILNKNPIEDFRVLNYLDKLRILDLSDTKLSSLKPLIEILKKDIPIKITDLKIYSEGGIFLADNQILDIPYPILWQGNEAIIQYYELQKNSSDALDEIYLNEAKLILVGEGNVGKTSLRVKLINAGADLPNADERTRGVDIDDYNFQLRNQENYTAHIWDFGGQNIQYALHRFFMTENSLYILMTESRNERDKNFMYWFQNIDLFGGKDSPILIVMNLMFGDRGANIDIASYVGEFKKIVNNEILEVNLLNPEQDNGLQKLRTIIEQQLENLPHIRKPIFRCWLDVRKNLQEESKTHSYISIERYQEICLQNGVEEPYFELVGRYLHNLGIVLWYHDKEFLRNKMILNPIWAITVIYKIIDDKKIQNNKGKFDNSDKDRLWNDVSYRFSKDELTSLLKVFKICFQRQNKAEYIVPALMDANPPSIAKEWDKAVCKTVTFEYTFMPKGIANQLTADMHMHILDEINHVWAYGVVLHYAEDNKTSAMITENTYNRFISIDVTGNYSNRFMGIIIQELKNINNSYTGLKCDMKIPCTCERCINLQSPQLYMEKDLIEKLNEGKTNVYCNKLDEKIDIQPILESIGITHPLFEKLKRNRNEEIIKSNSGSLKNKKVFISYSHKQTEYLKIFSADLRSYLKMPAFEFEIFDDFAIPVGEKWDIFLQNKVTDSDIIILLVSQEFMNSDYIQKNEFKIAMNKLKNDRQTLIAPVYFSPCDFSDEKDLKGLQFFKPNGDAYGVPKKGTDFSYADIVSFDADRIAFPNPDRQRYMLDFVKRLKELIN